CRTSPAARFTDLRFSFYCSSTERAFLHIQILSVRDGDTISVVGPDGKEKEAGLVLAQYGISPLDGSV
ncbi:MAG: hypothetical protein ACXWMC_05405, partial [Syntrophales bacterium]